jgi:hypothetical protein
MYRKLTFIPILLIFAGVEAASLHAATLQQLSMDQMSRLATNVVRARVTGMSSSFVSGAATPTIYTHYQLAVSETWKGSGVSEVMLPGGDVNGRKQSFPGVPELKVGSEYVLFLWKSPTTGIMHTIGLTQGIFDVKTQADGSITASRRESGEVMLDRTGHRVADKAVSMKLGEMKSRVAEMRK